MEHKTQKSGEPERSSAAETAVCEVFYDGACPLCRAEIDLYRRSGADVQFTDVSGGGTPPIEISRETALKRFHMRRRDGQLVSGAAAFAQLWKATPGWRWLGHVAALPPFVWIGEGLYRVFLVIRPALQGLARRVVQD